VTPPVTVVVAARDAAATLGPCLASIRAQDYPAFDVIVADDGSHDETAAIARSFGVRIVETGGRGPSAARNAAVNASAAEIVAFTDSDCCVPPHWLRTLVRALEATGAASVGGPQRSVYPAGHVGTRTAEALDAFFRLSSVVADYTRAGGTAREVAHNASCNSAYRRQVLVEAGGFREGLWPSEDVELDYRLRRQGHRCYYVPDAVVEHHRGGGPGWFAKMMRRYGRSQGQLVRIQGPVRAIDLVTPATILLVAAQLLLVPRQTRWWMVGLDAALAAGAVAFFSRSVPVRLWPDVARLTAVAVAQWNAGYVEGLMGVAAAERAQHVDRR
jgi:GT2 family glycosyltransferase